MESNTTEIEALLDIDNLFSKLNEEERERILTFIMSKYKLVRLSERSSVAEKQVEELPQNEVATMTVKDFINLKKPEGFYERIACLAFYLEKVIGLEGFKTSDITQANKDARQLPMSNPTYYVNDTTTKYGFLMPVGSGKKSLSARGEALVEALPSREKVREVLEQFTMKKKASKKNKKAEI